MSNILTEMDINKWESEDWFCVYLFWNTNLSLTEISVLLNKTNDLDKLTRYSVQSGILFDEVDIFE